jgi:hypothetical protein
MNNNKEIDRLVEKVVGEPIQKDMEMVSRTFNTLIKKYSFLFDGDMLATQKMLCKAAFPENESIVMEGYVEPNKEEVYDKIYFDIQTVVSQIPQSNKDALYEKVFKQFASMVSVEDLRKEEK